jgi:hypothetical protein
MSAIKHYHHDLIERKSRLYKIIELQKMEKPALIEIGCSMNITIAQASEKQTLIYAILKQQTEITPALKGDYQTMICNTKAPFRAGGAKQTEV